jgi:hypothetical protein
MRKTSVPPPSEPLDLLSRTGLRAAAEGIASDHPDRDLLCDLAALNQADRHRSDSYANWNAPPRFRIGTKAEAGAAFMQAAEQHRTIESRVIRTAAHTPEGAAGKLRFVLDTLGDGQSGTMMDLPISAIRDALAIGFGDRRGPAGTQ